MCRINPIWIGSAWWIGWTGIIILSVTIHEFFIIDANHKASGDGYRKVDCGGHPGAFDKTRE